MNAPHEPLEGLDIFGRQIPLPARLEFRQAMMEDYLHVDQHRMRMDGLLSIVGNAAAEGWMDRPSWDEVVELLAGAERVHRETEGSATEDSEYGPIRAKVVQEVKRLGRPGDAVLTGYEECLLVGRYDRARHECHRLSQLAHAYAAREAARANMDDLLAKLNTELEATLLTERCVPDSSEIHEAADRIAREALVRLGGKDVAEAWAALCRRVTFWYV
jgi:hypothetical protein